MDPNSNIARWVAFLLGPLAALIAGFVTHIALSVFGYHLNDTATTAWVLGVTLGVAGLIGTWLHNRGKFEIASLLHLSPLTVEEIEHLIATKIPPAPAGEPPTAVIPPPEPPPPAA